MHSHDHCCGHDHSGHKEHHHHDHSHNHVEEALEILKEAGYKHTNKRQRLVEILNDANRYLSAKQVQELIAPEFPQLSYDTIYRNLYTFVQLNILEETELNGEKLFMAIIIISFAKNVVAQERLICAQWISLKIN